MYAMFLSDLRRRADFFIETNTSVHRYPNYYSSKESYDKTCIESLYKISVLFYLAELKSFIVGSAIHLLNALKSC